MNPFLIWYRAAYDPECISLRITLCRVAKQSRLCESLIDAAENGKEVTVLMELRARFDEQNNIEWAERLEGQAAYHLRLRGLVSLQDLPAHLSRRHGAYTPDAARAPAA
ncbi:MAG: hypothetical protein ACLS3M_04225 [Collinsella sp.]